MVATPTDLLKAHDAMTDKLPPAHLRDLADLFQRSGRPGMADEIREEAARREAEAKELGQTASADAAPIVEREGLDSADAPTVEGLVAHAEITADGELRLVTEEAEYMPPTFAHRETWEIVAITMNQIADLLLNQNDRRYALLHEFATKLGERSEELKEYAKTLPFQSERIEDKPAPADADFAHSLRSVVTVDHSWPPMALSIIRRYETDRHNAADKIEAQAREIAAVEVSRKIAQDTLEMLKARVAELEAKCNQWSADFSRVAGMTYGAYSQMKIDADRTEQAEAKAARLVDALEYIAHHVDGTTRESIRQTAFNALAALLKENKDAP